MAVWMDGQTAWKHNVSGPGYRQYGGIMSKTIINDKKCKKRPKADKINNKGERKETKYIQDKKKMTTK